MSEPMAAVAFKTSTPRMFILLFFLVSSPATFCPFPGRTVAEELARFSAEAAAEGSLTLSLAEAREAGEAGYGDRPAPLACGDPTGVKLCNEEVELLPWTSLLRRASAVLDPLTDRAPANRLKSAELVGRDRSMEKRRRPPSVDGGREGKRGRPSVVEKMMFCGVTPKPAKATSRPDASAFVEGLSWGWALPRLLQHTVSLAVNLVAAEQAYFLRTAATPARYSRMAKSLKLSLSVIPRDCSFFISALSLRSTFLSFYHRF